MGSANNWLGFSLSPNVAVELQDERQAQQEGIGLGINTTSSDWMPSSSQNSFFILDSIHRSSQPHHVEWQQNTHCGSMDLSMIVGGGNRRVKEEQAPKLEDFLGGASRHYSSGRNVDAEVPSSMEGSFYGATAFNNSNNSNGNHHHPPAPQNIVSFNGFDMADSHLSATAKRSQDNTCEMNAHAWHALGHHQQQQQQQHHIGPECSSLGVAVAGPQHNAINATGLSFLKTWFTPTDTKPIQNTLSNNADININEDGFNYGGPASCSTITSASNPTADNANINVETHRQPQQPVAAQQGNELNVIQSLSLSMSSNSQSTTSLALPNVQQQPAKSNNSVETSSLSGESKKRAGAEAAADCKAMTSESNVRKSIDTFGQRTSVYRGVTRHRWTGRYEAHLWDNSCRREGQTRKGRQVYLGGYDKEEKAARAYDLAALKYWGPTTTTNFPISNYEKELEEMKHMTRQEYVASLRRKSSGFSRGASIYRGVTRHHQHGRWQARIGRVAGNKDLYLGTFSTQEEAAEAYDIAAIKFRGLNAVTNFDMSRYDVKSILASSTLPLANHVKRIRDADSSSEMPLPLPLPSFNHNYSKSLLQHQHHNPQTDAEANKWPALLALHQHRQQKQQQPWYKQEQTHFATSSHPFHTNNCNNNNNPGILHNLNIMGVGMNVYQDSASAMDMQMMDDNMMIMEPMPVQETLPSSNNNTNHQMKVCVSSAFGDHSSSPASFCNLNMNMYSYDAFPKTTPIAAGEVGAHRGRGRIAPGGLYYANADTDGGGSGSAVANDNENDGNWTNAGNVRSSNGLALCQATPIFSIWNDS